MKGAAQRVVDGVTWPDPIAYLIANGFDAAQARAVLNAYRAFYGRGRDKAKPSWVGFVAAVAGIDELTALAIMRRYREFYGK